MIISEDDTSFDDSKLPSISIVEFYGKYLGCKLYEYRLRCMNDKELSIEDKLKLAMKMSEKIGVLFKDSNGNYRPYIDILQDFAKIWEENKST